MKLTSTRWFRAVAAQAAALARDRGLPYPSTPEENAVLHAEVERQMGAELVAMVRAER